MPDDDPPEQTLPSQEKFFTTEKLRRSARAGTQLPNPTMAPFGYDAKAHFRHLFPALELPALFPPAALHPDDHASFQSPHLPPHQLYHGDNLYVLRGLPSESVDLIYIDPPFFSNRTYTQIWGDDNEVRSFNDIFHDGMFSYLAWLNARLWEMKRVLKATGTIYVHCDWHASHYIKCELDKVFGYENVINEVVWCYEDVGGRETNYFKRKHDVIFMAQRSAGRTFNVQRKGLSESTIKRYGPYFDNAGKITYRSLRDSNPGVFRKLKGIPADLDEVWMDRNEGQPLGDWWTGISPIKNGFGEAVGYKTQKPEALLDLILRASTNPGDVVADFFMGGGTTGAVALKLGRRFIGCDVSRVAVSVTASRLIDIGEQLSGVTLSTQKEKELGLNITPVADIKIGYVGSYPQEKFRGIGHGEFVNFILTLYDARPYTQKADWIHGLANNKIVISVGPGDPAERVDLKQLDGAVRETVKQYQKQLGEGEERLLQVIGWSFDPQCEGWKRKAVEGLNAKGVKLQVELVSLGTESFRQKVFRNVGESNIDLKFNRLNELLSFTGAPYAGRITVLKRSGLTVTFQLEGARSIGAGGHLINCQWDFSYDGKRFASRAHALNRTGKSGAFEAVLTAEHEFAKPGTYVVAARVQDNLDGRATAVAKVEVSERNCRIVESP